MISKHPVFALEAFALVFACLHPAVSLAQADSGTAGRPLVTALWLLGETGEDHLRLAQLTNGAGTEGFLLRSPSSLSPGIEGATALRWGLVAPHVDIVSNSNVPFSLNDGPMWAGVGQSYALTAGLRAEWRRWSLVLAPQFVRSANDTFPQPAVSRSHAIPPGRSPFSSTWHTIPNSADIPIRPGDSAFSRWNAGQSALWYAPWKLAVGLATENDWWGPGVRNAIVLSNNAAGFPHLFVRSNRPIPTAIGTVEFRWLVGGLTESAYFDTVSTNNLRSLAALGLVWNPKWVPGLGVGFARAVFAPVSGWSRLPLRLFNVFAATGRPNARPISDSTMIPGRDQIYSVFARWVFPDEGFEAWGEWARTEFPTSFRDFLTAPNHTMGYTLGLQWAKPLGSGRTAPLFRIQTEITYLQQSTTFRDRPMGTYYASRAVIQGFTERGEVLGAAIGPGGSSQWLAMDYVSRTWSAGLFVGRTRWEDDVLYELPAGFLFDDKRCSHDVSVFGGVRGEFATPLGRLGGEIGLGQRNNLFFRHFFVCGQDDRAAFRLDVKNTRLVLRFTPGFRL